MQMNLVQFYIFLYNLLSLFDHFNLYIFLYFLFILQVIVMEIIIYYVMMIYEINRDHQNHRHQFIITFSS